MKKFTKSFALILVFICIIISACAMIFIPKSIETKQLASESAYPQSAISTYIQQIKDGQYDQIYEDSLKLTKHFNSKEDYIDLLKSTYDSIDTSKIQIASDSDDSTLYHLVYESQLLADVIVTQDSDGSYLASTVFTSSNSYTIEIPTGSKLTLNNIDVDSTYLTNKNIVASIESGIDKESYDVYRVDRYYVTNLISIDSIAVDGNVKDYIIDSKSNTIYPGAAISDSTLESTIIAAGKAAANYPSQEGAASAFGAYCITSADFYQKYITMENTWYTSHSSAVYSNEQVTKLIQLDEKHVYANQIMDYDVSGSLGSKTYHIGFQMLLYNVNGTYKIAGFAVDSRLNPLYEN